MCKDPNDSVARRPDLTTLVLARGRELERVRPAAGLLPRARAPAEGARGGSARALRAPRLDRRAARTAAAGEGTGRGRAHR